MGDVMRTAGMIAAEINTIKAQARDVVCRSAIEIGRRLYEAKAIVPHGGWIAWLQENVDYSERTAQNLMRVYEEYGRNTNPQAIADLSYTQAVILLGLDRDARAELMENTDVAAMSTRDLQAEVDRLNDEIRKNQVTIDQLLSEQEDASGREKETETQLEEMRSAWQEEKEAAKKAANEALNKVTVSAEATEIGIEIANYACQFVGNPYKWGGTSLTEGADCSGFVMSVYANFGVELPHSSAADRKVGYAVGSLAEAIPGDLVCYSGHVALYIGNGQIVHASTEKTGIIISNADYREILCIRRIF